MLGLTPFNYLPKSIRILLSANAVVFLLALLGQRAASAPVFELLSLLPCNLYVVEKLQVWRLFTYMFTHFDLWHFIFNMMGLWSIGPVVHRYLGEKKFIQFYLGSGVFAALISMWFYSSMVGASGALFALFYAFARFHPDHQVLLFFVIPIRAETLLKVSVVASLLLGFASVGNVAHFTHLGGLLAGFLYFKFLFEKTMESFSKTSKGWKSWAKKKEKTEKWQEHVAQRANVNDETFFEKDDELDIILQKIGRYGMESLDENEKSYIDDYSLREQIRKGKVVSLEEERRKKEKDESE